MKLTKFLALVIVAALSFAFTANADRTDKRQKKQSARIRQGVKSGELTKGEAKRARSQQRRIRRAEKKAKADGTVTDKEKKMLARKQNRASRNIKRMKHNDRKKEDSHLPVSGQGESEGEALPAPVAEE